MSLENWWEEVKSLCAREGITLNDLMLVSLGCGTDLCPEDAVAKLKENLNYYPSQSESFVYTKHGI